MKHPLPPALLALICFAVLKLSACSTLKSPKPVAPVEPVAPATFSMEQIAPRVHVDPKMTKRQRQALSRIPGKMAGGGKKIWQLSNK